MSQTLMSIAEFTLLVDGLDHPEGVSYGPDGFIYAGGEAGQIYRISLDGDAEQIASTGGFVLGLCLDADGNIYACDSARHAVMRIQPDGDVSVYSDGDGTRQMVQPNYPVFDRAGNLYVSDSGTWHGHDGCLWLIRADGTTQLFSEEVTDFPNGLALDRDGTYLYSVVSQRPGVVRLPIGEGCTAGTPEEVLRLDKHVPDGIAFDSEDALYIACYAPDVIYRVSPQGGVTKLAEDWERVTLAAPTNVAFCGPELRTLVVGSLGRWHLAKATVAVSGLAYHYPRLAR